MPIRKKTLRSTQPRSAKFCISRRTTREPVSRWLGLPKHNGTIVSIDIDNNFDGTDELLQLVDILIASREFGEKLFGTIDDHEFLRRLKSKFGCAVCGITLGEEGSLIYCEDQFIKTDGYKVPGVCKDTTGAGDSFRAGFLYGLLKNESVETAAKMANAVAALKCREIGARTALPNQNELENLLNDLNREKRRMRRKFLLYSLKYFRVFRVFRGLIILQIIRKMLNHFCPSVLRRLLVINFGARIVKKSVIGFVFD